MATLNLLDAYNEVKSLMKANVGNNSSLVIDYTKLDSTTSEELHLAISKVLDERARKLGANLQGANNEFVIH